MDASLYRRLRLLSDGEISTAAMKAVEVGRGISHAQLQGIRNGAGTPDDLLKHLDHQKRRAWSGERSFYPSFFATVARAVRDLSRVAVEVVTQLRGAEPPAGDPTVHDAWCRLVKVFVTRLVVEIRFRDAMEVTGPNGTPGRRQGG